MTLRKGTTLVHFAASIVAVAMLSDAHPAAALPALFVTVSAAQPIAAAGSDATANQGFALPSRSREGEPVYTTADWVKAASACTKIAELCKTAPPKTGVVRKMQHCAHCRNTCGFAYVLSRMMDRPVHELRRWNFLTRRCLLKLVKLTKSPSHGARDGTLTT